ncbi:hypothetical protein PMAYCL1PPCAC_18554, partial [Pristionchus mayeri]
SITMCASVLSEKMVELFESITFAKEIPRMYEPYMMPEQYDPRKELKESTRIIQEYLDRRAKYAFQAKQSLESRNVTDLQDEHVNNKNSQHFIRYMSAKKGSDATVIYPHNHLGEKNDINETRHFEWTVNANFYQLNTSNIASAVHVPTPLYDRDYKLLQKVDWSNIDVFYRSKRDETSDLGFQLFCSESGFMRFFPATTWYWENEEAKLDLFDCRNTEWYINSATCSKNVIIMLDMSGSMLGQRFEIAKQTTEAILETLSHNDYFNMMTFSKEVKFLDNCNGTSGLLQATMRNKKDLRERLDFATSEGKAEYEIALREAFAQLLQLPPVNWTTREAQELRPHNSTDTKLVYLSEHIMVVPKNYEEMIENATKAPANPACENVIMLITDGAPQRYEKVFEKYNKEKKVRFFSFLIGEEAIDFDQVEWMACNNAGYMVHIANMADVEEKVQQYIRVMSRPVGKDAATATINDAMWSGVYRERLFSPRALVLEENDKSPNKTYAQMNKIASKKKIHIRRQEARSRMFVSTVSYPVSVNDTFMGVAAVNIPLTEISQLAAPMMIGGRSYYFMLDRNGFVMFHPQLRAMEERQDKTRTHKPNYNNMDILELEVPEDSQNWETFVKATGVRKLVLKCDNTEPKQIKMLFASDSLDRVYPQSNEYYTECVGPNKDFVLGLAISGGDNYRIRQKAEFAYDSIDMSWFAEPSHTWRIHPHWRYCILNDTTADTKEEAFRTYAQQMHDRKKLPGRCQPRKKLVERLLFDMKSTAPLRGKWTSNEDKMQHHEAHVVYFTSPSGMIRFHNVTLKNFSYSDITIDFMQYASTTETFQDKYEHFIAETNRKSVDDKYYRRAIRNDGVIVFDINYMSKIWYKEETTSPFGLRENATMLYSAYRSIKLGTATLGVSGMELGYDALVKILSKHGCPISNETKWCVLLDEHGYVFFSNQLHVTNYAKFYTKDGDAHLGKWFGKINRVSQRAMELLVEKKYYIKYKYLDHQGICYKKKPAASMASRAESWIRSIVKLVLSTVLRLLKQFEAFTAFGLVHNLIQPVETYTSSFHDIRESFSCTKSSNFYFANRKAPRSANEVWLVDNFKSERPCGSSKCSVNMQAAFVENTNLIMVWINQDKGSANCYTDSCPMQNSDINFTWDEEANSTTAGWQIPDDERCMRQDPVRPGGYYRCTNRSRESESDMKCSGVSSLSIVLLFLFTVSRWL